MSQHRVKKKRPVTPNRLATLESLSFEIMTNTLPIDKLKRVVPEESLPIHQCYPILSNYRKTIMKPSVKEGKQKVAEDMQSLHKKLNDYFKCDNFPLSHYQPVPKEHPRKYRLLKAIETENIKLPVLPKH